MSEPKKISKEEAYKWLIQALNVSMPPGRKGRFQVDEENKPVLQQIARYLAQDPEFENFTDCIIGQPSLQKGLCIMGNYGSGKTILLRAIHKLQIKGFVFGYRTTTEVSREFASRGYEIIERYKKAPWAFDDLGAEEVTRFYGQKEDVMRAILTCRYEAFQDNGSKTFITTNLTRKQMLDEYGPRVESRMHEMFNFILLGGKPESTDRRK